MNTHSIIINYYFTLFSLTKVKWMKSADEISESTNKVQYHENKTKKKYRLLTFLCLRLLTVQDGFSGE